MRAALLCAVLLLAGTWAEAALGLAAGDRMLHDAAARHGRTLLQAPPLTIKVFAPGPNCAAFIADSASRFKPGEDIANASAWAAANGRQTLTYLGITDLSDLGTFDILFAYLGCAGDFTPTSPAAQVFTPTQSAAVAAALTSGSLKKLMVWHPWNDPAFDNGVPGVQAANCSFWFDDAPQNGRPAALTRDVTTNPVLYAGVGASPSAGIASSVVALGACPAANASAMPGAKLHTWNTTSPSRVTGLSYCFGRGSVFYSTVFIELLIVVAPPDIPFYRDFHANSIGVFTNDNSCSPPSPPPPPPSPPPPSPPPPSPPPSPPAGTALMLVGRAGCRSKLAYATAKPCTCGKARRRTTLDTGGRSHCGGIELGAEPQRWRVETLSGRAPAAGEHVIMQAIQTRPSCAAVGTYAAAATRWCAGERVELSTERWGSDSKSRWVLHAGPTPGTLLLSSVANANCPRRFLGAADGCQGSALRLYSRTDRHALLVWRLAAP